MKSCFHYINQSWAQQSFSFYRYECSAINDYGRATGDALVRVRQPGATDTLVIRAFQSATEEIDRAINKTLSSLFNSDGSSKHVDPFRLIRFPNAIDRAAARPAELFERTLINIRRMVDTGSKANVTGEFRYEEILTAEQVKLIIKRTIILHMYIYQLKLR